ncbi:MAG TPA: hypothetical protein VN457_04110 [Chlamydiales bacterium]|nr:hypothetical protein [Chlamydiales bacterium]
MKKAVMAVLSSLFLLSTSAAYCDATVSLKTGTYDLKGNGDGSEQMAYGGKVYISPMGKNYKVNWAVGQSGNQTHYGIGILEQNVLSVSFYAPRGYFTGTVAYLVNPDGTLVGKWAPVYSDSQGVEKLTWLTDALPNNK